MRDDGAGDSRFGKLFAHAERLLELSDELEEVSTALSNDEMTAVVEVMCKSLHKATSRGNVSISLAAQQQVCKIPEYVMAATARRSSSGGGGTAKSSGGGKAKVDAPKPAAKSPGKRPAGGAGGGSGGGSSGGSSGGGSAGGAKAAKVTKWADVAGEKGPNGLARMVGGNPAGEPCSRHAKPGGCPFTTCSFSH